MVKEIPVSHKIDEGVPIPVRKKLEVPMRDLKVGQSVVFALDDRPQVQNMASRLKRLEGKTYTVKKEDERTARVWRVS